MIIEQKARAFLNFPIECDQDSPLRAILVKTRKANQSKAYMGAGDPILPYVSIAYMLALGMIN